jgi:hypothetical protein
MVNSKYEVSNLGRLRNLKTGRILKTHNNEYVRPIARMCIDGKQVVRSLAKLVGQHFVEPYDGLRVRHIDKNFLNCKATNLRWQKYST